MGRETDDKIKRRILPKDEMLPIISAVIEAGGEFELAVTGISMQPFLIDRRDRVYLAECDTSTVRRGDILFYTRSDGSPILHRVYEVGTDGTFTMIGDNQWWLETGVPKGCVIAKVTRCVRNGKKIVCGKSLWDRLMRFWLLRMKAPKLFAFGARTVHYIKRIFVK